jgi:choline-glycine betaine transporter
VGGFATFCVGFLVTEETQGHAPRGRLAFLWVALSGVATLLSLVVHRLCARAELSIPLHTIAVVATFILLSVLPCIIVALKMKASKHELVTTRPKRDRRATPVAEPVAEPAAAHASFDSTPQLGLG